MFMKKILSIISGAALFAAMGCDKNSLDVPLDYNVQAKVKINYSSAYAANPTVQLKINDQRVSSNIQYAYPFPGGGLNTQGGSQPDYFSMKPGDNKFSLSIPKVGTNTDSIVLYTSNFNVPGTGYYSLHVSDTTTNTQSFLVEENTATPDSGFSSYRFVNLMPNTTALDLYFNNVLVAGNIPYKGSSSYFTVAFPTASSWAIRPAGASASSTALATYTNTSPNQRVFVVFARGYSGSTDANRKPNVSLYYLR